MLLLVFALVTLIPLYFLLVNSFKSQAEYLTNPYGLPSDPTLATLKDAFRGGDLLRWLGNSALFTAHRCVLSTVVAAMAAYPDLAHALASGRVPDRRSSIALMVRAADRAGRPALQDDGRPRPAQQLPQRDHRLHGDPAAVLDLPARQLLPHDAARPLDAARLDGAGHLRTCWSIVLPLGLPALVTVATVQALWVWNEVLIAVVFLQSEELRTLMVGITLFQCRYDLNVPLVMAGMLWATIPMVILYLVLQRFFIRGSDRGRRQGVAPRRARPPTARTTSSGGVPTIVSSTGSPFRSARRWSTACRPISTSGMRTVVSGGSR